MHAVYSVSLKVFSDARPRCRSEDPYFREVLENLNECDNT